MRKKINSHLPALLGLSILVVGFIGGVFGVRALRTFQSKASDETAPQQIRLTNVGSSSFVVSWLTKEKATGTLVWGENSRLENQKKDLRDQELALSNAYFLHFVLVDGLKGESQYYFKVVSAGKVFARLFEVITPSLKVSADSDLAQGKILQPDGQPAAGVLVYLSLANTLPQTSLTDNEGHWMIPLSMARTPDLMNLSTYDRQAQIEELMVQGENQTATATLTTGNDNPAPDITLGQTYNFLSSLPESTITPGAVKYTSLPQTNFQNLAGNSDLSITFPSENEKVNSALPEFFGYGPKEQKINIEVKSDQEIISTTNVDTKSQWQWSPSTPLAPGEHEITVSYADKDGFVKKVSRKFIVLAAGESDLPSFTATPSGRLTTPVPTIGLSPTPAPKITITPTPSLVVSPTAVVTTAITTATPTAIVTSKVPTSGAILPTKLFFGAGVITILIGTLLILF